MSNPNTYTQQLKDAAQQANFRPANFPLPDGSVLHLTQFYADAYPIADISEVTRISCCVSIPEIERPVCLPDYDSFAKLSQFLDNWEFSKKEILTIDRHIRQLTHYLIHNFTQQMVNNGETLSKALLEIDNTTRPERLYGLKPGTLALITPEFQSAREALGLNASQALSAMQAYEIHTQIQTVSKSLYGDIDELF